MSSSKPADARQLAYEFVEKNFDPVEIYGEFGSQLVQRLAARASTPVMPLGLALQIGLCSCSNGAVVELFPGNPSPLSIIAINCNATQTRKSQLTQVLTEVAQVNDAAALRRAQALAADSSVTKAESCMLANFTPQAFLSRSSSEWKQVHFADGSARRCHFANVLNLDECYRFLGMVGLIGPSSTNKASDSAELASELNRILQTGLCSYACKVSGSFGTSTNPKPVGVLGFGNAHPSKYVPCLTGSSGQHDVACRERLLQTCGRPVDPHHGLPPGLEVDDSFDRWCPGKVLEWLRLLLAFLRVEKCGCFRNDEKLFWFFGLEGKRPCFPQRLRLWAPLLDVMVEPLGLQVGANKRQVAERLFEKAPHDVPGEEMYRITLADGTETLLRFRPKTATRCFACG